MEEDGFGFIRSGDVWKRERDDSKSDRTDYLVLFSSEVVKGVGTGLRGREEDMTEGPSVDQRDHYLKRRTDNYCSGDFVEGSWLMVS